jgi:hypothetical protein
MTWEKKIHLYAKFQKRWSDYLNRELDDNFLSSSQFKWSNHHFWNFAYEKKKFLIVVFSSSSRFKWSNHRFWNFAYKWIFFSHVILCTWKRHWTTIEDIIKDESLIFFERFLRDEKSLWLMLKMCALRWLNVLDMSRFNVRQNMMFAMCLDTTFVVSSRMFFYW